jgi:hypothetical protein
VEIEQAMTERKADAKKARAGGRRLGMVRDEEGAG